MNGVDVLLLFFFGIGVVEAEIGFPAEFGGKTEIQTDGFGVADVEVAVGLGRKAGLNDCVAVFFGVDVFGDDVAEEIGGAGFRGFRIRADRGYHAYIVPRKGCGSLHGRGGGCQMYRSAVAENRCRGGKVSNVRKTSLRG